MKKSHIYIGLSIFILTVLVIFFFNSNVRIDKTIISEYKGKQVETQVVAKKTTANQTVVKKTTTTAVTAKKVTTTTAKQTTTSDKSKEVLVKVGMAKLSPAKTVVKLNKTDVSITKSKMYKLQLIGGTIKSVATSNAKVAVVYRNGLVKAVNKGACFIYVKGTNNIVYRCKVTVTVPSLNSKKMTITVGDTYDLNLSGTDKSRSWSVRNTSIATVKNTGVVVGRKAGKTKVYCECEGINYTCDVTVVHSLNDFKGKKLSILGDSISTFDMYIPTTYKAFYPYGDVLYSDDTWWGLLCQSTGMKLLKNCSWSRSSVTGNSLAEDGYPGCSTSRIDNLASKGVNPEVIICYIGINDFIKCAPIGDWIYDEREVTDSTNVKFFDEAYALMLKKIHEKYPKAEVICCTLSPIASSAIIPRSHINRAGISLERYNNVIENVARIYGDTVLDVNGCGFNNDNFHKYYADGATHPNLAGMKVIRNKMVKELDKVYN